MDEKKEERKKESIDDILSDLNGLLNKMPAILEGITLPEIKPLDFGDALKPDIPSAAPEPAPAPARVPELENFPKKEDAFDKTMKPDESRLPGPAVSGEKDEMVLQSLGEYMFAELSSASGGLHPPNGSEPEKSGPGAQPPSFSVEPAGLDSAPELPEIKPIVNKTKPEVQAQAAPAAANIDDIPGIYSPASKVNMDEVPLTEPENMDEEKKDKDLEGTKDFGAPDIDAMIKLSMEEALPGKASAVPDEAPMEQAAPAPAADAPEEILPQPEPVAQPDFEKTLISEPVPAPEPAAEAKSEPDLENLISEPVAGIEKEKSGGIEPKEETPAAEKTPAPQGGLEVTPSELKIGDQAPEPGLVIEQPGLTPAATGAVSDDEKTIVVPPSSSGSGDALENTLSSQPGPAPEPQVSEAAAPAGEPASVEPAPGIERPNSAFGGGPVSSPGGEDKTIVVAPPSGGEDEKTVIYEAGAANPATTSRRREDLDSMSAKPVPEGIPPERVRTVAFLYAREDAALCSDVLAELDAICLKSPSKPMFIQRAFVQICEPGMNGAVVMQKVTDAKALGVVVLGEIPQENVYEIENVFTAGGTFFRHINREGFSHSAVLDLVTELILK